MTESSVSRLANLTGAFGLVAADRLAEVTSRATGRPGADTAALVLLTTTMSGTSQEGLGRALGLTQTGVVRLVRRLVESGLAERRAGHDARTSAITPTEAGRQAAHRALRARQSSTEDVLAALTPQEQEVLVGLLEKMLGGVTGGVDDAVRICRLCDTEACGHEQGRCPVTRAARGGSPPVA